MANDREGSVAPRERVNIRYKSAAAGAHEDVELPLRILLLGDLTGAADPRPLDEREPVSVDKDNFAEVMAAQGLRASVDVPDHLSGEPGATLHVDLAFRSLADFRPEGLVQQVEPLRRLKELRDALRSLRSSSANVPGFLRRVQELLKDPAQRERLLRELGLEAHAHPTP